MKTRARTVKVIRCKYFSSFNGFPYQTGFGSFLSSVTTTSFGVTVHLQPTSHLTSFPSVLHPAQHPCNLLNILSLHRDLWSSRAGEQYLSTIVGQVLVAQQLSCVDSVELMGVQQS
ncbi:hypothetical protein M378DRAFT_171558 [Amanita muscaria Koide BX008]|uniref:Uncharacterized protein n=1 Tax=Amanita muscaria (strain Koide BX008) TaxID=946122 RepID=A0A0C2WN12_AMAMK|nr:hypothetical protein M378DRAFT_171558 [Amanita muscaria Koide BX008]